MVQVNLLFFILYGFLASMLPFAVVLAVLNRRAKRKVMAFSAGHNVLAILFAIYIFAAKLFCRGTSKQDNLLSCSPC